MPPSERQHRPPVPRVRRRPPLGQRLGGTPCAPRLLPRRVVRHRRRRTDERHRQYLRPNRVPNHARPSLRSHADRTLSSRCPAAKIQRCPTRDEPEVEVRSQRKTSLKSACRRSSGDDRDTSDRTHSNHRAGWRLRRGERAGAAPTPGPGRRLRLRGAHADAARLPRSGQALEGAGEALPGGDHRLLPGTAHAAHSPAPRDGEGGATVATATRAGPSRASTHRPMCACWPGWTRDLGQMSGLATRGVLHREYHVFGLTAEATSRLDTLNRTLWAWVEGESHHSPHRGLDGRTPPRPVGVRRARRALPRPPTSTSTTSSCSRPNAAS